MDQWLDSLSEDWVSQPRSPHSSPPALSNTPRDSPSPISNGSQSRIPRYKPRAASGLSTASGPASRPASSMRRSSEQGALKEKSSSYINASQKRLPDGKVQSPGLNAASMRLRARQALTGSMPALQQDTVQHKFSPIKATNTQGTPEWKRRVLKENMGKGDLFSPIGLEGVFKPPTVKSKGKEQAGKKKLFAVRESPSITPPCSEHAGPGKKTNFASTKRTMSPAGQSTKRAASRRSKSSSSSGSLAGLEVLDADIADASQVGRQNDAGSQSTPIAPQSPVLPPHRTGMRSVDYQTNPQISSDKADHSKSSAKTRDENISPLYVTRHNTVDGRMEFAALDMSVRRLRSEMEKVRMQQQNLPSSRSSDHGVDYTDSRLGERSVLHDRIDEVTSQSLPDDLSMGTDAFAANGGFVSVHRGGYSNDGSFQRRPVSPSLLPDLDGPSLKLPSSTLDHGKASREISESFAQTKSKTPSSPPETPSRRSQDQPSSYERPKSSGSPLKIFDKYDTFTNERLVRRLSKFEATLNQEIQEELDLGSDGLSSTPSPGPKLSRRRSQRDHTRTGSRGRRISSFGDGDLDSHRFSAHERPISGSSPEPTREDQDDDILHEYDPHIFRFERSPSYESVNSQTRRKHRFKPLGHTNDSTLARDRDRRLSEKRTKGKVEVSLDHQQPHHIQAAYGKRQPYSPAKDPAPKRRRTLRDLDHMDQEIAELPQHFETLDATMQSLHGRKRKDARYDSDQQAADPDVIARRQMLRPKAPTLNRASHLGRQNNFGSPTLALAHEPYTTEDQAPKQDHNDQVAVDAPTQIVAGALATVALNTVQEITGGSRKASVTTADFFNEAQHIMQLLRAKGRPRSSHTTAETSEVDHPTIMEESVIEDSTKDEFSRPPSREGGSPTKLVPPLQMNPRVVSHLRKFEDKEDLGLAISSSLKNLQISQSNALAAPDLGNQEADECYNSDTESDPPNVRIRESTVQEHKRTDSTTTYNASISEFQRQHRSHGSQSTSGPSTSRSNPTGSSHSSTNKMVIAPETVAHLLADEMAGMAYDHQRQVWVRCKSTPKIGGMDNLNRSASEGTEEDFFRDIPDLSVNEMEELQRVKEAVSSVRSLGSTKDKISVPDLAISPKQHPEVHSLHETAADVRPRTADGKSIDPVDNSSAPSKYSHFAFSGPAPGTSTRATSWGDNAMPPKEAQLPAMPRPAAPKDLREDNEHEVEHEISILEGRFSPAPKHPNRNRQARVVTVAFSSPLVDQRERRGELDDGCDSKEGDSQWDLAETPARNGAQRNLFSSRRTPFGPSRPGARITSLRQSISNQSIITRPMSRLDEQDEMSLVHCSIGDRHMSMEVAITTPLPVSRSLMVPPTTNQRSDVGFFLSPLPDFTVNQIDRPLDGDLHQVTRRRDDLSGPGAEKQLSLAAQDLVKTLTDLQPYEPYWEHLRSVDLHDRDLRTLHMLDDFCGRVEEVDVSNNQICELNGIPRSVRLLNIRGNRLSDLAAWYSLRNLQYLDVSDNELSSLKGFSCLVHLRALKADNNEMESLDGIGNLDGLTRLSLQGNKLRLVDFESCNLKRLTHINLSHNELTEVSNLHQLSALDTCDLSHNDLESLDFSISDPLHRLQSLNISNNNLTFIDLDELPSLKTLNLDQNSIGSIESIGSLKRLENLSWRNQELIPTYGFSEVQYQHCHELCHLYLSGNHLSIFAPSTPFLNLHHLELASMGLKTLSSDFGPKCPNLRTLNINYNAIQDLRPLLGVVKLENLHASGNRISKLRRMASVLQRLCAELKEVDLRNNPLTVGYYTPSEPNQNEKRVALRSHEHGSHGDDEDGDLEAVRAYLLPLVDKEADIASRERLDEDTKIRRRVYEMMVVHACRKLQRLDGLEVSRKMVGRRDGVWERLVELGVLNGKGEMDTVEPIK